MKPKWTTSIFVVLDKLVPGSSFIGQDVHLPVHPKKNLLEDDWTLLHPSVTDPAEPDPVDYSPLPSENLASPVPSEYFDFTQQFLCFPSDCAVWIENPSVFLQTNNRQKK